MNRVFGRTNETVAAVWHESPDGVITAGDWTGLVVHHDELDRRGGERLREQAAKLGRPFDFAYARGLSAGDLKVGWPLHRLQRFRDEKLLRYVVIEAADVLDAEWIAANAPVHGVAIEYSASMMAPRYRVFDAAANAGVALVGVASQAEEAALHLATPQIVATLLSAGEIAPSPLTEQAVELLWQRYSADHAEPPKLRGMHPPDTGV
ncbi:MAG: hypothetical protein QM754_07170 [Tepidisphaeraceae bacterium]